MDRMSNIRIRRKKFLPLFIYVLSVFALFLFLYGFFPFKYSEPRADRNNVGKKNIQRRYIDKLAFIIIDALRYDFVYPEDGHKYMPFTLSSILNKESCYTMAKAHSPTVTLPRLKAITSGSVSSYTDVILNFMTPAFKEDNFVNIAVSNGLKLVFYGDDTWLKLFPNSFIRSEGTNSFFTYDYVEVDNNVTRHIHKELERDDWDIIILHYLGLDHIGHTEGPNSALVKPKLFEMDNIVKQFNLHFQKLEKNSGLKTMLIVTADHGMKDSGSHGGVTYPEITVPLISVGKPCAVLPGWPEDHSPLQIDIAPTLTAAFGLPFPSNNMGKIIPSLLYNMPREDLLWHLELNRLELSKFISSKITSKEDLTADSLRTELENWLLNESINEKVVRSLTNKYFQSLHQMSQELVTSNSDYKLVFLLLGVICLWICLFWLLLELSHNCPRPKKCIHWFFVIATAMHAVSLFSNSFIEEEHQTWYFFWATFHVLSFLEVLHFTKKLTTLSKIKFLIPWVLLIIMHRILRKLNQTGDKWALLPDIKFYLHSEEGQGWLFPVFLLGIGMVFSCAVAEKCSSSQLATYGISLLAVITYRVATGSFRVQYLPHPQTRESSEIFFFWTFFAVFTIQTAYNRTPFYLVWLALSSLLLRPHNVILPPIQVFTSKRLYKLFHKSEDMVWNNIAHIWLGNVFYFYQGNGNSLSNVDVAAGFVGVETYIPFYAGVMIVAHTFGSHILSFLLSPKSDLYFALSRAIPLTVYSTAVITLLNHLFIWSVFSPKLLYDSSITILFLLLLVLNYLLSLMKSYIKANEFLKKILIMHWKVFMERKRKALTSAAKQSINPKATVFL